MNFVRILIFIISLLTFFAVGGNIQAATVGESADFYIQPDYDTSGRSEILTTLVKFSSKLYFYVDQDLWYGLSYHRQVEIRNALDNLAKEFEGKIYPILTGLFGMEWNPGIDKDERITVLIHPMPEEVGGYFNSGDEYPRIQVSTSNQREMVYLNYQHIETKYAKNFLAAEFMHLIVFNRKDREHNVSEEVWLNEALSEYAATLLGYDNLEIGNPFRGRLETFSKNPNDPLCEWYNEKEDYAVVNIFIQYLVDHYGNEVLVDALHTEKTGIEAINYALEKNGFEKDFAQIFTDWAIAVLINDCQLGPEYCYKNEYLKNFRVAPSLNYLPLNGKSSLVINDALKNWAGKWYKFVGGGKDLEMRFIGSSENKYRVPYLTKDFSGNWEINFFELNQKERGEIFISDFGTKIISVTVIPVLQTKTADFSKEVSTPFFLEASTITTPAVSITIEKPIAEMSKEEILEKIASIEELLSQLKDKLKELIGPEEQPSSGEEISCSSFEENLFYGLANDERVKCLQEFLKAQGEDVYPEGLITGNFLGLTQTAVIRFQEKYASEILHPLGLEKGTGFVGSSTRAKINEMMQIYK